MFRYKKKSMRRIIIFSILVFSFMNKHAQVTIGLDEAPVKGALLQLKNITATNSQGGANATKGLCMPRCILTNKFDLDDILSEEERISNYQENHIGLVLYQIGSQNHPTRGLFCPGLYVWDGKEWQPLFDIEIHDKSRYDELTEILYDIEGNDYKTASFGSAGRWMTQNIRSKQVGICGGEIGLSTIEGSADAAFAEPHYYYPGGTKAPGQAEAPLTWTEQQGLLYNWSAATNRKGGETGKYDFGEDGEGEDGRAEQTGLQGICPKGWHLPSDKEWNDLEQEIGMNPGRYTQNGGTPEWNDEWRKWLGSRGNYLGEYIKTTTILNYNDPFGDSTPYNGGNNAINTIQRGFDAMLTGDADAGYHSLFGIYGLFWTHSGYGSEAAWIRQVEADPHWPGGRNSVGRYIAPRDNLLSVRCKQDGT